MSDVAETAPSTATHGSTGPATPSGPARPGPKGTPGATTRFRFDDVVAQPPGSIGAHARPWGVTLLLDAGALTIIDRTDGRAVAADWSVVEAPHCGGRVDRSDGVASLALTATVAGNPWRWLIPADQLPPARTVALNQALAGWSAPVEPPADAGPAAPPEHDVLAWDRPTQNELADEAAFEAFATTESRPRRSRSRRILMAGLTVLWVLVVAGLVFELVTGTSGKGSAPAKKSVPVGQQQVAQDLNVVIGDFPAGWHVDSSPSGPLAGFLSGSGGGTLTAGEKKESAKVTATFESCMGVRPSADRVFGPASSVPLATAASPAFAAPAGTSVLEAGSVSTVYADPATVSADMAFVKRAAFPSCFGAAFGDLLAFGAGQGATGAAAKPVATAMTLPQTPGVSSVGVSISVPIASGGTTQPLQLSTVFVGGGKSESTLYLYGFPESFPVSLAVSLVNTLEHNMSLLGGATAT